MANGNPTVPMQVSLLGMSERTQRAMKIFFDLHCKDFCVLSDHKNAHVSLIDLDDCVGKKTWKRFREQYPKRPSIVLALRPVDVEGALFVGKPIKPSALKASLERVRKIVANNGKRRPTVNGRSTASIELRQQTAKPKAVVRPTPKVKQERPERCACVDDKSEKNGEVRNTHDAATALIREERLQVGTMPDIDPRNPSDVDKVQYRPERFFQSVLQSALATAKEEQRYVKLRTVGGDIVVFPGGRRVQARFSSGNCCRALCSVPIRAGDVPVEVLPKDYRIGDLDTYPVVSAESLLWQTALFSARGRVPAGTSLNDLVYMKSWPNMTRLPLFPHAVRIAALWANLPYSLVDTAKVLRIRQRYVFAFFSAASVLGKVGTIKGKNAKPAPARLENSSKSTLFSRILARLHHSLPQH